jgi:hypothetical protein
MLTKLIDSISLAHALILNYYCTLINGEDRLR